MATLKLFSKKYTGEVKNTGLQPILTPIHVVEKGHLRPPQKKEKKNAIFSSKQRYFSEVFSLVLFQKSDILKALSPGAFVLDNSLWHLHYKALSPLQID